jgi:DNA polymerase-1
MPLIIANLRLNVDEPKVNAKAKAKEAAKSAESRKKASNETMEEAWQRIAAMKNSEPDLVKLREVAMAMKKGELGREPGKESKKFSKSEAMQLHKVLQESQREAKIAELVASTPENYELILDIERLREVVDAAMLEPIVAVDTETTGLDVLVDKIVGVSITIPSQDRHYYVPITPTVDHRALPAFGALLIIRRLIESHNTKKVFHNAIFDMAMFKRHDIVTNALGWDTQTAMHVLNENEGKGNYKLKVLATRYLGAPSDTFAELFGKNAKFADVPLDVALVYGAKDTHITWDLYLYQRKHLERFPTILEYYENVEVPLLYVIFDLERNGYILDLAFAKAYGVELSEKAAVIHERILKVFGVPDLNLNSVQQLKPLLSQAIGVELESMDAKKVLKPLASKHPVVADILEYKALVKLSGTYIDTLPTKIHPLTGRLYSRFNTMGTVTGRFSTGKDEENKESEAFNVQNQPAEARKMFKAPPGKVIIGADFKAQEIRCVAHLSGEPALIKSFKDKKDPYANLAVAYTGLPYEEVNKNPDGSDTKWRKQMKVAWLAWLYGASDFTLGEWLGTTKVLAGEFMSELRESLPILAAWLDGNTDYAEKNGFVWIGGQQRKRRLPDAKLKHKKIPYGKYNDPKWAEARLNNGKKSGAMRQATNARVQGESAIQMKVTMIAVHKWLKDKPGWEMYATIHDELLLEAPEDFSREELAEFEQLMLTSYLFGDVENGTDIEVSTTWGEGVSVDEWFSSREGGGA